MENTKTLEIIGWTDNPANHEFKKSETSPEGVRISDRFTIYLEPEDREKESNNVRPSKFRINFWGDLALLAYELMVSNQQRVLLKLKDPRVSQYVDRHQGKNRVSLNINFRSQFDVLDHADCPIGNGFEIILQKLRARESGQIMNESPFDVSPI